MATQIHRHLLMDSKQPEVNYNSYQERTLCVVIGGTFMFSITILISSLFKWCRTRNNNNDHRSTNTSAVLQQQQEPAQCNNSTLSAIPVIIYGLPSSSSPSSSSFEYVDNVCSICLAEFVDGENLRVLPCKHVFHKVCIDQWILSRSLHCPVCRDRTIRRDVEPDQRTVCNNPSAALVLNFAIGPHALSHL